MNIKEIVLKAGHSTVPAYWLSDEKPIACSTSNFEKLVSFAEALIAEIAKQNEHIGAIQNGKFQWNTDGGPEKWRARKDFSGELYTSDQVAAAILKATKPLEEEIDRLESESEEYAQLQSRCFDGGGSHASVFDEVSELRAQLAAAQEENDALRRIHKENIDILVKELSDKDYEYNQKINRLTKLHAEQIRRCNDEVNRRRYNSDSELPDDYEVN